MIVQADDALTSSTRILIVDDIELNRRMLRHVFAQCGFKHFKEAGDGAEALRSIEDWQPDLVLLDVMMPGVDGLEVCTQMALGAVRVPHPPVIIVQTVLDDTETKQKLFAAGATDYVTKPLDMGEVLARSMAHLQKRALMASVHQYSTRLKEELAQATRLQQSMLPAPADIVALEAGHSVTLGWHYRASEAVGGDMWGLKRVSDSQLGLYIADFSGHGLLAAMNTFRLHTMLQDAHLPFGQPDVLLSTLCRKLQALLPVGQFATMLYALIDVQRDTVTFANAAAPPPLLRPANGQVEEVAVSGVPLGCTADAKYPVAERPFRPGDALVIYSDGFEEYCAPAQGSMEMRHVLEAAKAGESADGLLSALLAARAAAKNVTREDDETLVSISRPIN